jgi:hypothetical protein
VGPATRRFFHLEAVDEALKLLGDITFRWHSDSFDSGFGRFVNGRGLLFISLLRRSLLVAKVQGLGQILAGDRQTWHPTQDAALIARLPPFSPTYF